MSNRHKQNNHKSNRHNRYNGNIKLTTEQFIKNARKVHGDRYNYDEVEYLNNYTKVIITCLEHGSFKQIPRSHAQGNGCPVCGNDKFRFTANMFVEKARATHGNKYNYDEIEYTTNKKPIKITCLKHGDFCQTPCNHINGQGCPICRKDKLRSTIKQFIEKAKKVHGDRYNYDKVDYISSLNKVIITCLEHGDFHQSPNSHLQGVGCPVCKSSKGEIAIRKILLKHDIEFTQEYSIPNQNNRYKYDFYLPKLNLIIEYHGAQHYIPVEYFGGEKTLNGIKLRDSLKKDIAKECGYKFLEIKYSHFSNSTEEEFEKKLLYVLTKTRSLVLTK